MSAAETTPAGEAEAICWAGMLDVYDCVLEGAGATTRMDAYLAPEVTVWDHTLPGLYFGQAGLDRMRANRAPDTPTPNEITARDQVVDRHGDVVLCRHVLDVRFRDHDDQVVRCTVVWALTDSGWREIHSHHDLYPLAPHSHADPDPVGADAVPAGPCTERLAAQRAIYAHALAGDPVSLNTYLAEDITVWDAWQEPMFFGYDGLAEMRSHRNPDAEPTIELVIEAPVYSQSGGIVIARHVLVCRYAQRPEERMRCTIVWQQFGDDWKIVHSHEDLLPDTPEETYDA